MVTNTISRALKARVPKSLFHYTSTAGLLGIINSGKIWATKIQYLNDNSELQLAFRYISDAIKSQERGIKKTRTDQELYEMRMALLSSGPTNICVASFTARGDQLSQWRGYSEIGTGYSLGFNGPKLSKVIKENGYSLARCVYREDIQRQMVKEMIDNFPSIKIPNNTTPTTPLLTPLTHEFSSEALFLSPIIKSKSFEEEKEWRLITTPLAYGHANFRAGNHSLIPYWEIDIDLVSTLQSIVIGPTPDPSMSARALEGLLMRKSFELFQNTKISLSKIPYRKV